MALRASEGYLGRDGSRVRQDGGPPTRWRCVLTGSDMARGVASTGAKKTVCSLSSRLFSCSNGETIDHMATRAGANQNPPIHPIYAFVYIVLRIYKSSIKYYTTMILMYGTRMYTKIRQFILL